MCGILNVISKTSQALDPIICRRALSKLSWRGPDYNTSQIINEGKLFLGQSILSITGDIDNSNGKHLISMSGRFHLNYNGEIYNPQELEYKLRKANKGKYVNEYNNDSQVLVDLHEYFPVQEVPQLLDGMYAFSVYDNIENKLIMSRDIQGEKSLYFFEDDEIIIISSSIQPILSIKPNLKINKQLFKDYFRTRHFMFFKRTVYENVIQLQPGHTKQLDLNNFKWSTLNIQKLSDLISPERYIEMKEMSLDYLTDKLDSLMKTCINQMVPERQFASVVSGGIDSSLISKYLVEQAEPQTLVAVDHIGKDKISKDLKGFESVLNRKINVIEVDLGSYASEIERCQSSLGSPLLSHSFIGQSIQSSFIRSKDCRVLFGGDGADELFGGYDCYFKNKELDSEYNPSNYTGHFEPSIRFKIDNHSTIKKELKESWIESLDAYSFIDDDNEKVVQAMMYGDFAYQLPSVGMRGTDLMSMMWSVETRSVFLRKPIIEFGLNLPIFAKSNHSLQNPLLRSKPILKKLFLKYFPENLLVTKQGFAGFPNESIKYLGNINDFITIDYLGVDKDNLNIEQLNREEAWKIINVEYFLRHTL